MVINIITVIGLFIGVLMMPISSLPDKVPDGKGGEIVWDDVKKQKIKRGALVAIPMIGFL